MKALVRVVPVPVVKAQNKALEPTPKTFAQVFKCNHGLVLLKVKIWATKMPTQGTAEEGRKVR